MTQTGYGENPRKAGPVRMGVKEIQWTNCVADDLRLFGIGDGEGWKTAALQPGNWWDMVIERGRSFMATWRKKEERAGELCRKKREAVEAGKAPSHRA